MYIFYVNPIIQRNHRFINFVILFTVHCRSIDEQEENNVLLHDRGPAVLGEPSGEGNTFFYLLTEISQNDLTDLITEITTVI